MPKSDDIVNLFHQFGGQADEYQEISRNNASRQSRARWPLLSALDPQGAAGQVPTVQPSESAGTPPPVAFRPAPVQPVEPLADLAPVVEPPGITPPLGTPVEAIDGIPRPVTPVFRAKAADSVGIPPQTPAALPAARAWSRQEPAFAHAPEPAPATMAAPVTAPVPAPVPVPVAAPEPSWAAAAASPLAAGGSPLARLGSTAPAPVSAPTPTEPVPASQAAPSGSLQDVFARLSGQSTAPAAAPIAALWRRLGGGA